MILMDFNLKQETKKKMRVLYIGKPSKYESQQTILIENIIFSHRILRIIKKKITLTNRRKKHKTTQNINE